MSNNSSYNPEAYSCASSTISSAVGIAFSLTRIALFFPLHTFILYLAVQKWKQQRSFTTAIHSDVFTYHLAAFALIGVLASGLTLCFVFVSRILRSVGYFLICMNFYGENFIHVLICVEQYLAVVHPIVYRGLRNSRGVRIRNISLGCVWLLTLMSSSLISVYSEAQVPILFMIPFSVCLVAVSYCCLSVLCVLIRPGPGEGGRVDQTKKRAFYTIIAIFIVLVLWLGGITVSYVFYDTLPVKLEVKRLMIYLSCWFSLPSGLVLPLLYLQRAGKLSFCCHHNV